MRHAFSHIACVLVAALLAVLTVSAACAAVHLPDGLTAIEAEAFMGDRAMTGLVRIPAGVNTVKADAFSGTGVFALELPATVRTVEPQSLSGLTYLRVESRSADLQSLPDTLKYIASPKGGLVQYYANFHHVDFYPIETLIADGGFYYVPNDTGLTLLSAVDNSAVPASVTIPEYVDGQWVNAVSAYAFAGCPQVAAIALPVAAEGHVPASATADCAGAHVSYYGNGPLVIKSVKASNEEPLVGEAVTFTVEVEGGTGPYTVGYEVLIDGDEILTEGTSKDCIISFVSGTAGTHRLRIKAYDAAGKSTSETTIIEFSVYNNEFNFVMPETLIAGHDLPIQILPILNSVYYHLCITDAITNTIVYNWYYESNPLTLNINGYLFNTNHSYEVSISALDKDGKELFTTKKNVAITGAKADAIEVVTYGATVYGRGGSSGTFVRLDLNTAVFEQGVVKEIIENNEIIREIDYNGSYGYWTWGSESTIRQIQVSIKNNGLWTEWSEPLPVDYRVQEAPLVALVDEEINAGQSFTILISEVEDVSEYRIIVTDTNDRYSRDIYNNYSHQAGLFTLEAIGPSLHAGPYRLTVTAIVHDLWVETHIDFIVNDGTRPPKPLFYVQLATEATPTDLSETGNFSTVKEVLFGDPYMLYVPNTEEVEKIGVTTLWGTVEDWDYPSQIQIYDSDGAITRIQKENYSPFSVFSHKVAVCSNGVWSEWSDPIQIKMVEKTSEKGITIVCPWGLGGGADTTIRPMANLLQKKLGIPVNVRNEMGASGVSGATYVYNMPADGHTFLLGTQTLCTQDLLDNFDFNFKNDFECEDILTRSIKLLCGSRSTMERHGINSFSELRDYAAQHPYEISIAMLTSTGIDGMCFEAATNGLPLNPLTYDSGSAANSDLAGGHVDLFIGGYDDMSGLIESGDIIPLLVFCEHRVDILPDCECTAELGIDCYAGTWRAIFAKKGTPQGAIDKLITAIEECKQESTWQQFLRNTAYDQRSIPAPGTETENFYKKEYKSLRDYMYEQQLLQKDYDDLK